MVVIFSLAAQVSVLAIPGAMLKLARGGGEQMSQTAAERARILAQNLVELLTSYEEELMALELDAPAMGQLRRAVGIAIAEACYVITDQALGVSEWAPDSPGPARRTG
jgi:hypothetical protein